MPFLCLGTGDLFAALFIAWSSRHPDEPKLALSKTLASLSEIIQSTHSQGSKELLLLQNANAILHPEAAKVVVEEISILQH